MLEYMEILAGRYRSSVVEQGSCSLIVVLGSPLIYSLSAVCCSAVTGCVAAPDTVFPGSVLSSYTSFLG